MRSLRIVPLAFTLAGLAALAVAEDETLVLDNAYAAVHRNAAPCADAGPGCGNRIIVAFGELSVVPSGGSPVQLDYAEVFVAESGESYEIRGREFAEINLKAGHPPVEGPAVAIRRGEERAALRQ